MSERKNDVADEKPSVWASLLVLGAVAVGVVLLVRMIPESPPPDPNQQAKYEAALKAYEAARRALEAVTPEDPCKYMSGMF